MFPHNQWWSALRFADHELAYVGTQLTRPPLSPIQVKLKGWDWIVLIALEVQCAIFLV